VLDRALHTERLTLRPAVLSDAEATWTFRQLSVVNEWLTGCPADIASYRELWGDPERLATTVVVQLAEARGAHVIGDFMLRPTTQSLDDCEARHPLMIKEPPGAS